MTTITQAANEVERAGSDPTFRARLLTTPARALQEAGITVPDGVDVRVVENTASVRYLVAPRKPEGFSADGGGEASGGDSVPESLHAYARLVVDTWSDDALRARLMEAPGAVLAERGITVPGAGELRVLEPDAGAVYLVIPDNATDDPDSTMEKIEKLLTAASYLAGMGFIRGSSPSSATWCATPSRRRSPWAHRAR